MSMEKEKRSNSPPPGCFSGLSFLPFVPLPGSTADLLGRYFGSKEGSKQQVVITEGMSWQFGYGNNHQDFKEKAYRINVDVHHFKIDEIQISIDKGEIVVEAEHSEREDDHGFITRHFVRKYKIPEDVDEKTFESALSVDGVLTLKAAKKGAATEEQPIHKEQQTDKNEKEGDIKMDVQVGTEVKAESSQDKMETETEAEKDDPMEKEACCRTKPIIKVTVCEEQPKREKSPELMVTESADTGNEKVGKKDKEQKDKEEKERKEKKR